MPPHGDSHMLHSHIGGAPVDITELHSAILRKNIVVAKADAEMICERLMFDPVVSGPLPQFAESPARVYNGQRLHLRPSLVRSTISQSRDTKCQVDQGREIAKLVPSSFVKAIRQ